MLDRIVKILTSLKLTVACLALGVVLVFVGTIAQADEGLYVAQARYFKDWYIWGMTLFGHRIPILYPGGYLLGTVLLVNLVAAHIKRFQFTWKKLGIHVTHAGIILLLVGQLATDLLSNESHLRFREGETKNYSESHRDNELVFMTDCDNPGEDEVVSIPDGLLLKEKVIHHEKLPFTVQLKQYYPNSRVRQRAPMVDKGPPPATEGVGQRATVESVPVSKRTDDRNMPSAVLELTGPNGSLGTWLASTWLDPQEIQAGGRTWRMALRWERLYTPYSMQLLKTTHDVYRGTDIPKNFQSRVRIENPRSGENREVDIHMNSPLRYQGLTYYQYQMGRDEASANVGTSTLQVVRNPSWLTPYVGCAMVGGGLVIQFMMHLVSFIKKRRPL
jgi:ResB-like family